MTALSYSPYFKLRQVKEPVNREIEIYAKMHADRERHERDARRAMAMQAENAEMKDEIEKVVIREAGAVDCGFRLQEERDAALARIAELEAALEPTLSIAQRYCDEGNNCGECVPSEIRDTVDKARAVLRNRQPAAYRHK